ncbi:hypothetical protein NC651_025055 [Populus alba x Populus x berolinensis]|nr:hypothetical protein NC651_025055 [Populus alba x Populus x berolinensis]
MYQQGRPRANQCLWAPLSTSYRTRKRRRLSVSEMRSLNEFNKSGFNFMNSELFFGMFYFFEIYQILKKKF